MEREDFERRYSERSMVTVETLHYLGRYAEPCDCGVDGCEGWAMGYQHSDALFEDSRR
jgi:hypothetical protein